MRYPLRAGVESAEFAVGIHEICFKVLDYGDGSLRPDGMRRRVGQRAGISLVSERRAGRHSDAQSSAVTHTIAYASGDHADILGNAFSSECGRAPRPARQRALCTGRLFRLCRALVHVL